MTVDEFIDKSNSLDTIDLVLFMKEMDWLYTGYKFLQKLQKEVPTELNTILDRARCWLLKNTDLLKENGEVSQMALMLKRGNAPKMGDDSPPYNPDEHILTHCRTCEKQYYFHTDYNSLEALKMVGFNVMTYCSDYCEGVDNIAPEEDNGQNDDRFQRNDKRTAKWNAEKNSRRSK